MSQELKLDYHPREPQMKLHKLMATHRFGVAVCHRRMGKTVMATMSLIFAALSDRRSDARYAYVAPFFRQAKNVTWDMFKAALQGFPCKFNEAELRIDFSNGSRISLYGGDNPDALRGLYFDGVVLDEVADMRPAVWGEVIRPALSDRLGWALFIGTPKGVDMFYDIYQEAMKTPGWFATRFPASETQIIPQSELDSARKEMSESAYAREFECDFAAGRDDVLIPAHIALESAQRTITDREVLGAVKVLGVDVARYGDDSSVIFPAQGLKAYPPIMLRKVSNIELAQEVMRLDKSFQPDYIRIDAGRGEGVIDYLRSQGIRCTEVNFGGRPASAAYANARAEMWHGMLKWMESGGAIPNDSKLITELSSPTYSLNNSNKMILESKEQLRARGVKSPDMADALALAVGVPLINRNAQSRRGITRAKGALLKSMQGFSLKGRS